MTPEELILISKAEGRFLIYGPASVEIVDDQGDKIGIDALKEAIPQLLRRHAISYKIHKDVLVGSILEKEVVDGRVYKTEVIGDTLYVLAEIYDDNKLSKKAREEIEAGVLKAYSISGQQIKHHVEYKEDGMPYNKIDKIDLFAVCICEKGVNPEARFKIISKTEFLEKKVEQRGSQWCVIHCHGPDTGKPIKCFPTEAQAQAMHRAIQARRNKADLTEEDYEEIAAEILKQGLGGGTGEGPGGTCVCPKCDHSFPHQLGVPCQNIKCPKCGATMERKESIEKQDGRPPKGWWDQCVATVKEGMPSYTDEQVAATCGYIWHQQGTRKPVKSEDVESAVKSLSTLKGKTATGEVDMTNPKEGEGSDDKTKAPGDDKLSELVKQVSEMGTALKSLTERLEKVEKQFPPKKPRDKEDEEDDSKKKKSEGEGGDADDKGEGENKGDEKSKSDEFKETLAKMSDDERKEFLEKTGLEEVKPDPAQWKKELEDMSAEDRKAFLEKAGFTVTETGRPGGAETDPKTGSENETTPAELEEGIEDALEKGDLEAAFDAIDSYEERRPKRGGVI